MFEKGIYNIYKPKGPSSYDIIRQIKRDAADKKIGHGGTLDPLASGVLIVAIGREFTKQLDKFSRGFKKYLAVIELGATSSTLDDEGEKTKVKTQNIPTKAKVVEILKNFTGKIEQMPPIYSALKINGQPAYKLARNGTEVELKPRTVEIVKIELVNYSWPTLEIRVTCGGGTYIRSLADDIGEKLQTGGYLKELVRESVAEFEIKDSLKI